MKAASACIVGYRRPWLTESSRIPRGHDDRQRPAIGAHRVPPAAVDGHGVYLSPYAEYHANLYDDTGDVKITQYLMQTARAEA